MTLFPDSETLIIPMTTASIGDIPASMYNARDARIEKEEKRFLMAGLVNGSWDRLEA